ncbi:MULTISPECIES: hypothetical protein [Oerskovia]|uniref:Uncharacterized protein n=1 Tax=Oerskovia enterophila TaxID=43678 RepID=A0A163QRM4_9CELL|nr:MULTISPECIES: hypothetical protein [Oerskovia]KZM34451.1 hypothetical protein OJAG_27490 [Oerskovia enterophila]OCI32047.1 hypothetical protein OERS_12000 [Oerskovia enterophila]
MLAAAAQVAQENAEAVTHLPIPPIGFGIVGFGVLIGLLLVTYAFRSVGTRH